MVTHKWKRYPTKIRHQSHSLKGGTALRKHPLILLRLSARVPHISAGMHHAECKNPVVRSTSFSILYYHHQQLNASAADDQCILSGHGRLAILHTEPKFSSAVRSAPKNHCRRSYYSIGLEKKRSKYVWLNGKEFTHRFADVLPDEVEQRCFKMSPSYTHYFFRKPGKIFEADCAKKLSFLCFKPTQFGSSNIATTTALHPKQRAILPEGRKETVTKNPHSSDPSSPSRDAVFPFVPVLTVGIVLLILLLLLIAYVVYKKHNKRISNRSTGQTQVLPHVPSTPKVHEVDPSKMKNKSEMPDEDDMISPFGAISYRQSDAETTESTCYYNKRPEEENDV